MNILKLKSFAMAALVMGLSACGGGHSKEEAPRKIEVTGSSDMEVVPDQIYVSFSLREYMKSYKNKVKLEDIKKSFLEKCKAAGIPDSSISLSSLGGNERWDYYWYWYYRRQPDFMNTVSYTILLNSPDKLDQLVSSLDEKSIQNFYISKTEYSKMTELRREVKKKALMAAKNKAEDLAGCIGEKVGEALLVQEIANDMGSDYSARSIYSNSTAALSNSMMEYKSVGDQSAPAGPAYEKIKIRYEVKAEFRLE